MFDPLSATSVPVATRIDAAEALGRAGDSRLDPTRQDRWIHVPEGDFVMGAQSDGDDAANYDPEALRDEGPVHQVHLESFHIGRFPVTVADFERFIQDDGYQNPRWWKDFDSRTTTEPLDWARQYEHPNRPVVGVDWYEANAYAKWASGRLPTEAQWERAARGNDARIYPWGRDRPTSQHLNCGNTHGGPTPVGLFVPGSGPNGIQDMAGNVFEWCMDRWGVYSSESPQVNPRGPDDGRYRVVRGGCWFYESRLARSSFRSQNAPYVRNSIIGFRVVSSASNEP
jgi:formylglycine-generating enzyme required for sulfatase activity